MLHISHYNLKSPQSDVFKGMYKTQFVLRDASMSLFLWSHCNYKLTSYNWTAKLKQERSFVCFSMWTGGQLLDIYATYHFFFSSFLFRNLESWYDQLAIFSNISMQIIYVIYGFIHLLPKMSLNVLFSQKPRHTSIIISKSTRYIFINIIFDKLEAVILWQLLLIKCIWC